MGKTLSSFFVFTSKHMRGWENSRKLGRPSTASLVFITVTNSPNLSKPPSCLVDYDAWSVVRDAKENREKNGRAKSWGRGFRVGIFFPQFSFASRTTD